MFYVVRVQRIALVALALFFVAAVIAIYPWGWPQGDPAVHAPGQVPDTGPGPTPGKTGSLTAGFRPPSAETVFALAVGVAASYLIGRFMRRWRVRKAG